jgi:hypothetical protein
MGAPLKHVPAADADDAERRPDENAFAISKRQCSALGKRLHPQPELEGLGASIGGGYVDEDAAERY